MNYEIVGQNIKRFRKRKKLTQTQLGDQIDKTESSIRKYEQGLTKISNDVIEQIAKALEVSPFDLLGVEAWEEAYNKSEQISKEVKLIEDIEELFGKDAVLLLRLFCELNERGREKAINDISDLTEIQKYLKD